MSIWWSMRNLVLCGTVWRNVGWKWADLPRVRGVLAEWEAWPRPTETLPRNMMLYFSLQQMWPWMRPQLILPSSCLKKGNELPGKRSVKIQKKKKEEEVSRSSQLHTEIQLHSPLCLVNWASAQGDTSGRCRLGTPVPGTWEFVG